MSQNKFLQYISDICALDNWQKTGSPSHNFSVLCIVYCSENGLKINITPHGKCLLVNLLR